MTAGALRMIASGEQAGTLFDRIGMFLADHRLSPEPAHYSFAYHVLAAPDGALARAVARITDGGVRLTQQDIAALGGTALPGAPLEPAPRRVAEPAPATTLPPARAPEVDGLISRTQAQVEGFADTVRTIQAQTSGFGRDLAASAAAIRDAGAIEEIARITGAMIARVHSAEVELANAHREADALRAALAEAHGCARQDPLTRLANRRAFDETFASIAPGTPLVIAMCDIDHFKRVNDVFGHGLGDRVLRAVGQTLADECTGQFVARYGGEEFVVLMSAAAPDTAWETIDRARAAVAARRFRSRETDAPLGTITISAGLATGLVEEGKEALIARADAALYRAKASGRNRVVRAPEIGG